MQAYNAENKGFSFIFHYEAVRERSKIDN